MKAWVLHDVNQISYEDIEKPVPAAGEVLVQVKAVGICGSDIPRIYQNGAHRMPLVPGHEFSGVVTRVGEGVSDTWLQKRVGIFPLIPCGKCGACKKKQYEMCRSYGYLGSRQDGGYAQYVRVPEWNLIELPDRVSYEEAAMLEPMAVAVHAMKRVAIRNDDIIAICGLGTIGLFLLMFLKEAGAKHVLVIGNKEFQKEKAKEFGICDADYFDSSKNDVDEWIMKKTDNKGVDVFFECVGKNETVARAIDCMAPAGKIIYVGNPISDMVLHQDTYWKILRNQLTLLGTWNSSYTKETDDDWHYVLEKLKIHAISPAKVITHRLALPDLDKGLHLMHDKTEQYIKVMSILDEANYI